MNLDDKIDAFTSVDDLNEHGCGHRYVIGDDDGHGRGCGYEYGHGDGYGGGHGYGNGSGHGDGYGSGNLTKIKYIKI